MCLRSMPSITGPRSMVRRGKQQILEILRGHVLAKGLLIGTYERIALTYGLMPREPNCARRLYDTWLTHGGLREGRSSSSAQWNRPMLIRHGYELNLQLFPADLDGLPSRRGIAIMIEECAFRLPS